MFSAGSVFWTYNLDSHNDGRVEADPNVQQAMVNLLAEMGIQPETLQSGLFAGVQSTDHTAPVANISSASGFLTVGSSIVFSGTSADLGGGVVGGVEFSGDGGLTWDRTNGIDNWNYAWTPAKIGLNVVEVRAVDDSLNLGVPELQLFGKAICRLRAPWFRSLLLHANLSRGEDRWY